MKQRPTAMSIAAPLRKIRPWAVAAGAFLAGLCLAGSASAQDSKQASKKADAIPFPTDPASWIGSPPLTAEMLQGKAAVLWFYEENCPKCRGKWPSLFEVAKKFEGKPLLFIAVNSGNPRSEVEKYLRATNVDWPTIVDPDRRFEKAVARETISLENIYQMRVLLPDGRVVAGDWSDFEGSAEAAAKNAKWKIDPAGMPAVLKGAWTSIELGDYTTPAALVKRSLASGKPDVKAAAEKLNLVAQEQIAVRVQEAKSADAAELKWEAYKGYTGVATQFKGYDLPPEVAARQKELGAEAEVKGQIAALKLLESIKKQLANSAQNVRNRAKAQLEKLVADQPTTDAAEEAKTILAQLGA